MNLFERGITARDIADHLPFSAELIGDERAVAYKVESIFQATPNSLVWVRNDVVDRHVLIQSTPASIVICGEGTERPAALLKDRCLIIVANPQHAFLRVLNDLVAQMEPQFNGIHPTSIVSPQAKIAPRVSIGPFAVIGACRIGADSVIGAFTLVDGCSAIGERVHIREHCTIGGAGFGHIRNEQGKLENMAHIGTVEIGNDVELFPFVNVDRGTLGSTVIQSAAKIDHYCHIGHNSQVGESSVITARVTLAGGARVGSDSWIGLHTVIRDKISIGNGCFLGMGSVVTKDVPDGESWAGAPARPLNQLKEFHAAVRRIANGGESSSGHPVSTT